MCPKRTSWGPGGSSPSLQADRGGAIAAPPGLEEHQRPVGGLEAMNHLEGRRGCRLTAAAVYFSA